MQKVLIDLTINEPSCENFRDVLIYNLEQINNQKLFSKMFLSYDTFLNIYETSKNEDMELTSDGSIWFLNMYVELSSSYPENKVLLASVT